MSPKKFLASNTREALRQIKEAMGEDAVILSNRKLGDQVEIVAARLPTPYAAPSAGALARRGEPGSPRSPSSSETATPAASSLAHEMRQLQQTLLHEIAQLKAHAGLAETPHQTRIVRSMVKAGFSQGLAEQIVERMPPDSGLDWVVRVLESNLRTLPGDREIVERGGVFALVGPTGVGKTTTTAKLAARAVVRYGSAKVALVTTDTYRVGAFEQLRVFGNILGVEVVAVRDQEDLKNTLESLKRCHLVLIDTMGVAQRDSRVAQQADMLRAVGAQRLLLLNATGHLHTLEDVVRVYRSTGVCACIPTKLDEAVSTGALLDVLIRHKLAVGYMANGQRVPEDLHEVNGAWLLQTTFTSLDTSTHMAAESLDLPMAT